MDTAASVLWWQQLFQNATSVSLSDFCSVLAPEKAHKESLAYIIDYNNVSAVTKNDFVAASKLFGPPKTFVANVRVRVQKRKDGSGSEEN